MTLAPTTTMWLVITEGCGTSALEDLAVSAGRPATPGEVDEHLTVFNRDSMRTELNAAVEVDKRALNALGDAQRLYVRRLFALVLGARRRRMDGNAANGIAWIRIAETTVADCLAHFEIRVREFVGGAARRRSLIWPP